MRQDKPDSGSAASTPSPRPSPRSPRDSLKLEKQIRKHERQLLTQDRAIEELYLKMKASDDEGIVQREVQDSCTVVSIAAQEMLRRHEVITQATTLNSHMPGPGA